MNQKIVVSQIGESFRDCTQLIEEAVVEPAPTQVRIRNHFAGVNGIYDQMLCANRVELTHVVPPVDAGVEAIGVVEKIGSEVDALKVGDPVATVGAGYCLYKTCDQSKAYRVPAATPEILALIPSGVSALIALERIGEMGTDETVCITAAAGGFGNIATQLAVNAGNHVVAVCGSDKKARWLRELGVQRVINYRQESLDEVLKAEYPDQINLAMDSVAGDTFDALLLQLAPHGRLVICGQTTDRMPPQKVMAERVYTRLYWKAASVRGFLNMRFTEYAADARERLIGMTERGEITPLMDTTRFSGLGQAADAGEHLLAGANMGKVILDLRV
ncbi:MAG: zinc-binding dehydrogenase [Lysobacterales bacterium]